MVKNKRAISIMVIIFVIVSGLIFLTNRQIKLIDTIPSVFKDNKFDHEFINGMTFINKGGESAYPISNDENNLYILNGAGYDFKNYYIDKENKEIVINKNILSAKIRNKELFQIVQIPKETYQSLISNENIKVRVNYIGMDNQSTLLEYNFNSKLTKVISHSLVGK